VIKGTLEGIRKEDVDIQKAIKGELVSFPLSEVVRKNDKFFAIRKRNESAPVKG